jgi:hypothetical protein
MNRRPSWPPVDRPSILAFAVGNPSEAFGEPYRIFDADRRIARLPGPPYCFMDRVIHAEPEPWKLEARRLDRPPSMTYPDEWYFAADRSGSCPFACCWKSPCSPADGWRPMPDRPCAASGT